MTRHIDDGLLPGRVLAPVECGYRGLTNLRNHLYDNAILRSVRMPVRVISIGNIVAGGAGKTPLIIRAAQMLIAAKQRVAVLSRGYRSQAEAGVSVIPPGGGHNADPHMHGDEAVLVARRVPEIAVLSGSDRVVLTQRAIDVFGVDVVLLDDGFQHRRLVRDLDIVVLRAPRPFGNGHLLPHGPLREPLIALKRAQVLVYNEIDAEFATVLPAALTDGKTIVRLRLQRAVLSDAIHHLEVDAATLRGARVIAAVGLARPSSFAQTLGGLGLNVIDTVAKTDHHRWSPDDIDLLQQRARALDAWIVTSEKDIVKWQTPPPRSLVLRLDVELDAPELFLHKLMHG